MYTHAVVGGTFDHFHSGHSVLLQEAFRIASHVTIGITTDAYVRQYKYDEESVSGVACPSCSSLHIQSFNRRKERIVSWLTQQGLNDRATLVPIDDAFGPTIKKDVVSKTIDVLVVSSNTETGARMVNEKRKQGGLPPLAVRVVTLVKAQDTKPISATRIRNKEIDTEGKLILPDSMRSELAQPFGMVLADGNTESIIRGDHEATVIAVGDKTTKRLLSNGIVPTLGILDMQVERLPYVWEKELWDLLPTDKQEYTSGPGYISRAVIQEIQTWATHPTKRVFVINGEEDLLVLPVIAYAPCGSIVYYGQPGVGMVRVVVTTEKKKKVTMFLTRFVSS